MKVKEVMVGDIEAEGIVRGKEAFLALVAGVMETEEMVAGEEKAGEVVAVQLVEEAVVAREAVALSSINGLYDPK